jgi:hypothetical protein
MVKDTHKKGLSVSITLSFLVRAFVTLSIAVSLSTSVAMAQQGSPVEDKDQTVPNLIRFESAKLGRLPIEWLIGPYIPVQGNLSPLTPLQREEVYVRQTFLTASSYAARAFSAGLDQARGAPYGWGGGITGYEKRYAARYGQFVVQNSLVAAGDAALGYEPRYDFCRCNGFWPRVRHAASRNFVAYNRTEQELRPQVPAYSGAFVAGMLYSSWLPSERNHWKGGAYSALSRAGIGTAENIVREFALDILHKFGIRKDVRQTY